MAWLWLSARMGARAGLACGLMVGIPVVGVGILLTPHLSDLALFISRAFLLLALALPIAYYFSSFLYAEILTQAQEARRLLYPISLLAWLPAFVFALVGYMMPATLLPITLGRGVSIENSGDWYAEVYTPLLQTSAPIVALVSLFGFVLAAYLLRTTGAFEFQPETD